MSRPNAGGGPAVAAGPAGHAGAEVLLKHHASAQNGQVAYAAGQPDAQLSPSSKDVELGAESAHSVKGQLSRIADNATSAGDVDVDMNDADDAQSVAQGGAEPTESSGSSDDTSSDGLEADGIAAMSSGLQQRRPVRRLLDRDAHAFQSQGNFNVRHKNQSAVLFWGDIYHVVIHLPLWGLLLLFVVVYIASFLVFAALWFSISDSCHIGLETFREAFYLSIETQMTIGYGVPDPYFRNCSEAVLVLLGQSLVGLVIDAMMIGIMFQHVSCAYTRASTVIFSNTAVLQVIDGCVHLIFRVAEMQQQPLLQAVMQVYCVQHHADGSLPGGVRVEVAAMQLKEPDTDMYNGVLFLGLPTMVVHRIDYSSPLSPPRQSGGPGQLAPTASGNWADLPDHPSPQEVKEHLQKRPYLEVLVLLSGTEDATASSIEARHSYTLDDMFWNRGFTTCVSIDSLGHHCINFGNMHKTYAIADDLNTGAAGGITTYSRRCFSARYEEDGAAEEDGDDGGTADTDGLAAAHGAISHPHLARSSARGSDWRGAARKLHLSTGWRP